MRALKFLTNQAEIQQLPLVQIAAAHHHRVPQADIPHPLAAHVRGKQIRPADKCEIRIADVLHRHFRQPVPNRHGDGQLHRKAVVQHMLTGVSNDEISLIRC